MNPVNSGPNAFDGDAPGRVIVKGEEVISQFTMGAPRSSTPTSSHRDVALPEHDYRSRTAIELIRAADVPDSAVAATFRYSRTSAAVVAGLMLSAGGALLAVGRLQGNPFAYYLAALVFVFLWIYQSMVLARFRPTNWLVRVTDRGLYIKFRSYLNHHFPDADLAVIYIPFREMSLARVVRELQKTLDTDGSGSSLRRRTVIEIDLKDQAPQIEQALAAERDAQPPKVARWYGSSAGRYRHYPVRMATPRTVAIEWGVVPGPATFLGMMAVHTPVEASEITRDYTALGGLTQAEQESRLLELTESGQETDAVRLARSLYGFDFREAMRFIEGLAGRAKG
jgi:hypothetical protein